MAIPATVETIISMAERKFSHKPAVPEEGAQPEAVRPAEGLSAGDYEAALSFSLDSGETVEVPVHFSVLPADSASA